MQFVHYRVSEESNRALETGSLYLVDSGAQYLDGTTDVTRTIAIGEPTAEMRGPVYPGAEGPYRVGHRCFPQGRQWITVGHPGPRRFVAGRHRL